jgi:hypothetical protein
MTDARAPATGASPPATTHPDASTVSLTIANLERGQVVEVSLSGWVEPAGWPDLQRRLEALVEARQPAELHLDLDDVGGLSRFPAGVDEVREALSRFGGSLVVAGAAER